MADDDWRDERRNWRGGRMSGRDRWSQDDAPQYGRRDRDDARLGYGPYARGRTDSDVRGANRFGSGNDNDHRYGRVDSRRKGSGRYDDDDRSRSSFDPDYRVEYRHNRDRWRDDDRDWMDRAGDEVASWFGDEDAEYRREMDRRRHEMERYRQDPIQDRGYRARRWRDDW